MTIQPGFYGVRQAGGDQDPADDEAWGLAMLSHVGHGRMIGVDQGGCRVSGSYVEGPEGVVVQMIYELKCGSHLPDGSVLAADHIIERELSLKTETFAGGHQLVDAGLGPMWLKFEWLADGPV